MSLYITVLSLDITDYYILQYITVLTISNFM